MGVAEFIGEGVYVGFARGPFISGAGRPIMPFGVEFACVVLVNIRCNGPRSQEEVEN
jgi:hypothetical protein